VVLVSDRFTTANNVAIAPAYTRFDATAGYHLGPRRPSIGVIAENLTNARCVTSGAAAVLFAGAPRRVALQANLLF
jgi:outer membrane receptor protein involved in Fe transport